MIKSIFVISLLIIVTKVIAEEGIIKSSLELNKSPQVELEILPFHLVLKRIIFGAINGYLGVDLK